jgi:hypothetical protein
LSSDEETEEYYNYFYNFVDSGVPVSLWSRCCPGDLCNADGINHTNETIEEQIKEILDIKSFKDLSKVIDRIYKLRLAAHSQKGNEAKKHLGYHLGFICDRPDLIPYNLRNRLNQIGLQGSN